MFSACAVDVLQLVVFIQLRMK